MKDNIVAGVDTSQARRAIAVTPVGINLRAVRAKA
jgi:hypothetical protein